MAERALELADPEFLSQVSLFAGLDARALMQLRRVAEPWLYQRGETILFAEQTGKAMYVLASGQVKVESVTSEGKEVILAIHGPGEFFGEMALLDQHTTPAAVIAMSPAKVLLIRAADFQRLLARRPVMRAMLATLCARCRVAWDQLKAMSHYTTEARLRAAFVFLADKFGVSGPQGLELDVELTHKVLAALTGVTREQITRAMGVLARRGLVVLDGSRHIVLPDVEALALGEPVGAAL